VAQELESIVFDFDYTLADSSVPVIDCVNYALAKLGLPAAAPEAVRRTIGLALPETLRVLAGEHNLDRAAEFYDYFVKRADEVMLDGTVLLEFVPKAVRVLRRSARLGIVSSKWRSRIETILGRERLLDPFGAIVGGEDVPALKPDPSGLRMALNMLDAPPERSLYVGDSVTDAETARRAGVPFVAVLSGVTTRNELAEYPAVAILDDIAGLQDFVNGTGAKA
jgi:phosphoglycolate phosphatase